MKDKRRMNESTYFWFTGSGKTYLAERLVEYLGDNVVVRNADKVREEANDWDFPLKKVD